MNCQPQLLGSKPRICYFFGCTQSLAEVIIVQFRNRSLLTNDEFYSQLHRAIIQCLDEKRLKHIQLRHYNITYYSLSQQTGQVRKYVYSKSDSEKLYALEKMRKALKSPWSFIILVRLMAVQFSHPPTAPNYSVQSINKHFP